MANIKSAKKRILVNETKAARNKAIKSKVKTYVKQVGGYTPNANKFRLYVVGVNGRAQKAHGWTKVTTGDTIVVPRRIAGNDYITPICDTLKGLASLFIMAFAINKW